MRIHFHFDREQFVVRHLFALMLVWSIFPQLPSFGQPAVLQTNRFHHYVDRFADDDLEQVLNAVPNNEAWQWMDENIPFFECPSSELEQTYYFRWWSFRKHIKKTPDGMVLTEFLRSVSHAGKYNTVSCAAGHHLAEARWLRDTTIGDEYTRFWFRSGEHGQSASHFHKFSSWIPSAIYDRYLVTGDQRICIELLDALVRDDEAWVVERQLENGLFWQYDVKDGMEESISGGRHAKNARPTINSYMAANARAIAKIAQLAGRSELAESFLAKYHSRLSMLHEHLWDSDATFFEAQNRMSFHERIFCSSY